MPTTLLGGETWEQAYARRFQEEAEIDARIAQNAGARYYVQIVGPAGRVTYFEDTKDGGFREHDSPENATAYTDEHEAADVSEVVAYHHLKDQKVLVTVVSSEEFGNEEAEYYAELERGYAQDRI